MFKFANCSSLPEGSLSTSWCPVRGWLVDKKPTLTWAWNIHGFQNNLKMLDLSYLCSGIIVGKGATCCIESLICIANTSCTLLVNWLTLLILGNISWLAKAGRAIMECDVQLSNMWGQEVSHPKLRQNCVLSRKLHQNSTEEQSMNIVQNAKDT